MADFEEIQHNSVKKAFTSFRGLDEIPAIDSAIT